MMLRMVKNSMVRSYFSWCVYLEYCQKTWISKSLRLLKLYGDNQSLQNFMVLNSIIIICSSHCFHERNFKNFKCDINGIHQIKGLFRQFVIPKQYGHNRGLALLLLQKEWTKNNTNEQTKTTITSTTVKSYFCKFSIYSTSVIMFARFKFAWFVTILNQSECV